MLKVFFTFTQLHYFCFPADVQDVSGSVLGVFVVTASELSELITQRVGVAGNVNAVTDFRNCNGSAKNEGFHRAML